MCYETEADPKIKVEFQVDKSKPFYIKQNDQGHFVFMCAICDMQCESVSLLARNNTIEPIFARIHCGNCKGNHIFFLEHAKK